MGRLVRIDVDAVQRRLVSDGLGVAGKGEMFGGDGGEIALVEQRELRHAALEMALGERFLDPGWPP